MGGNRTGGWLRVTLLSILGVLAVLALTVTYCLANPASLKPLASYLTETLTGRTLVIDGTLELDLDWSLQPRIMVTNARYSNAEWADNPDIITADYAMIHIDLMALFDYHVDILDLDFRGAMLYLEDRLDGEPNWRLFRHENAQAGGIRKWSFMIQGLSSL